LNPEFSQHNNQSHHNQDTKESLLLHKDHKNKKAKVVWAYTTSFAVWTRKITPASTTNAYHTFGRNKLARF